MPPASRMPVRLLGALPRFARLFAAISVTRAVAPLSRRLTCRQWLMPWTTHYSHSKHESSATSHTWHQGVAHTAGGRTGVL